MEAVAAWSDFLRARERFDEQRSPEAQQKMEAAWRAFCDAFDPDNTEEHIAALRRAIERERA